jgi:hypothetical protein
MTLPLQAHESDQTAAPAFAATGQHELTMRAEEAAARVREMAVECVETLLAQWETTGRLMSLADSEPDGPSAQFRSCLAAFTTALKAAGNPPEVMVVEVKRIVAEAAARAGEDARSWVDRSVTWAIQSYYAERAD